MAMASWTLIIPVVVDAKGKEKPETPDMEMLEFLGTFETAGGKGIDPLQLEDQQKLRKGSDKSPSKGPATKKTERKNGKGGNDE